MIYRNIKTGAEIFTESKIISPNYVLVEEKKEAPKQEPPKEKQPKPETKEVVDKVKTAPKKRGTRK